MNVLSAVSVQDCRVKQRSANFNTFSCYFVYPFFFNNGNKQNKTKHTKKG